MHCLLLVLARIYHFSWAYWADGSDLDACCGLLSHFTTLKWFCWSTQGWTCKTPTQLWSLVCAGILVWILSPLKHFATIQYNYWPIFKFFLRICGSIKCVNWVGAMLKYLSQWVGLGWPSVASTTESSTEDWACFCNKLQFKGYILLYCFDKECET